MYKVSDSVSGDNNSRINTLVDLEWTICKYIARNINYNYYKYDL